MATRFEPALYLASESDILKVIHAADAGAGAVLVIGHNPGIEDLAGDLARDGSPPRFPTCALAVFTFDTDDWTGIALGAGHFEDFLTPKMLRD